MGLHKQSEMQHTRTTIENHGRRLSSPLICGCVCVCFVCIDGYFTLVPAIVCSEVGMINPTLATSVRGRFNCKPDWDVAFKSGSGALETQLGTKINMTPTRMVKSKFTGKPWKTHGKRDHKMKKPNETKKTKLPWGSSHLSMVTPNSPTLRLSRCDAWYWDTGVLQNPLQSLYPGSIPKLSRPTSFAATAESQCREDRERYSRTTELRQCRRDLKLLTVDKIMISQQLHMIDYTRCGLHSLLFSRLPK